MSEFLVQTQIEIDKKRVVDDLKLKLIVDAEALRQMQMLTAPPEYLSQSLSLIWKDLVINAHHLIRCRDVIFKLNRYVINMLLPTNLAMLRDTDDKRVKQQLKNVENKIQQEKRQAD